MVLNVCLRVLGLQKQTYCPGPGARGRQVPLSVSDGCLCRILTWWRESSDVSSSYKGIGLMVGVPPLGPHVNLIKGPRPPPSNTITLGVRVSTEIWEQAGEGTHTVHKGCVFIDALDDKSQWQTDSPPCL